MKRFWFALGLMVCNGWGDISELPRSPFAPDTQVGKELYSPITPPVDPKVEKSLQQEGSVPGGRNEPMHSYSPPLNAQGHSSHEGD